MPPNSGRYQGVTANTFIGDSFDPAPRRQCSIPNISLSAFVQDCQPRSKLQRTTTPASPQAKSEYRDSISSLRIASTDTGENSGLDDKRRLRTTGWTYSFSAAARCSAKARAGGLLGRAGPRE